MNTKKIKDISGNTYGEISVISFSHVKNGKSFWNCICCCGKRYVSRSDSIKYSKTGTCGHDRIKNASAETLKRITKHGMFKSKTYSSWLSMKNRCTNKNHESYHIYGDISICESWLHSFENFFSDMGERPDGMTIDRVDNSKGYCKENCRWATPKQQARNTKANHLITIEGETMPLSAWCEKYGTKYSTAWSRINKGIDPYIALSSGSNRVAEWRKA